MKKILMFLIVFCLIATTAMAANKWYEKTLDASPTETDTMLSWDGSASRTVTIASVLALASDTYQPLDDDLTIYAGITPSANVQTLLSAADYAAFNESLGLGLTDDVSFASVTTTGASGLQSGVASSQQGALTLYSNVNAFAWGILPAATPTETHSFRAPPAASGGDNFLLNVDADGTMDYTDPASIIGGSALEIENDSVSLDTAVIKLNFLGTGVTAVENADHEIDVTIGGGAAPVDSVNTQTGTVVLDADDVDDSLTTHKFVTSAQITLLGNTSGSNSGDNPADDTVYDETSWNNNSDSATKNAIRDKLESMGSGNGDMLESTYDPTAVAGDAFSMDNMVEGTTTKILTAAERTTIAALGTASALDTGITIGDIPIYVDDGSGNASLPIVEVIDTSSFGGNLSDDSNHDSNQKLWDLFDEMSLDSDPAIADITDWPAGVVAAEVGYLDGVTSGIQAQINGISGGTGYVSTPTYSNDTCTTGQRSFDTNYVYLCESTDQWDRFSVTFATWDNPIPTAPTLTSATIGTNGTTFTLLASEAITIGSGGNGGWNVDCATAGTDIVTTYSSGDTTDTLIYTLGTTVNVSDTCNVDYVQPGDGWEDASGDDLASITDGAITNDSTQGAAFISDDFSGDLSAWTIESGNWSIVSEELTATASGLLAHNTSLDSITQYVVVKQTVVALGGVYFRFDGNTSNNAYAVRAEQANGNVVWRYCTNDSCSTIATWVHDFDDNDYMGVEIEGTGSDTIVRVWDFGPSQPTRGSWGAATHTFTDDPGANAADVGEQVGLYTGSTVDIALDDFEAGSYTP